MWNIDSQAVQEVLSGRHGDGDLGRRLRGAGAHVAGQMGPVRAGRDRRLVFDTAGHGGPVAEGDPVHGRVRRAVFVDRGVLREDLLHRAENGAEVARDRGQQPPQQQHDVVDDIVQAVVGRRRAVLHTEDPFQGARDIHRLGHRVQHGHRHVLVHHRLQGTALPVAARHHRRRVQFVRPRRQLLADIVLGPQAVQAARPFPVVRPERHHHASRVRGKSALLFVACPNSEPVR